jgi:IclR family acetate operon transcriptional repressor
MRTQDRIFLLLEQLSNAPRQTLAEVADHAGLPRPTALRFLRSLEEQGWVTRDAGGRYSLGPAVIALAHRYLSRTPVLTVAARPMQELRDTLGETVSLSATAGDARVCVQEYPSPASLRHVHEVGSVGPLHAGASGRMLLAHLPADRRATVLAAPLPVYTDTTVTDAAALQRACEEIREQGWVISHSEKTIGSVAIAVPIRDPDDGSTYALTVFAPEVRFDRDRDLSDWVGAMQEQAQRIEEVLGSHEPQAVISPH